jgi:hypothetical protein
MNAICKNMDDWQELFDYLTEGEFHVNTGKFLNWYLYCSEHPNCWN